MDINNINKIEDLSNTSYSSRESDYEDSNEYNSNNNEKKLRDIGNAALSNNNNNNNNNGSTLSNAVYNNDLDNNDVSLLEVKQQSNVFKSTLYVVIFLLIVGVATMAIVAYCLFSKRSNKYVLESDVSAFLDDVNSKINMVKGNNVIYNISSDGHVVAATVDGKYVSGHFLSDENESVEFSMQFNMSKQCTASMLFTRATPNTLCVNERGLLVVCDIANNGSCVYPVITSVTNDELRGDINMNDLEKVFAKNDGNVHDGNVAQRVNDVMRDYKDNVDSKLDSIENSYYSMSDVDEILLSVFESLSNMIT